MSGGENDRVIGEIGILEQLSIGVMLDTSLFLTNDYQCSRYMGPVYFDDPKSCYAIYATKFYGGPLNQGNRRCGFVKSPVVSDSVPHTFQIGINRNSAERAIEKI